MQTTLNSAIMIRHTSSSIVECNCQIRLKILLHHMHSKTTSASAMSFDVSRALTLYLSLYLVSQPSTCSNVVQKKRLDATRSTVAFCIFPHYFQHLIQFCSDKMFQFIARKPLSADKIWLGKHQKGSSMDVHFRSFY